MRGKKAIFVKNIKLQVGTHLFELVFDAQCGIWGN
jgi:hypothetical protein